MVATEIVILPLKAPIDLEDRTSDVGKATIGGYEVIAKAPGFVESWYGAVKERPSELQMFVNWNEVQDHMNFTQSESYKTLGGYLSQILGGPPSYLHFNFTSQSELKTVLSAPVTECVTLYTKSVDKTFEANVAQFGETVKPDAKGASGYALGWSVEDVEHEKLGAGVKGKALKLLIGWESVEAHMAYRETESFKSHVQLIRDGAVAIEMCHVEARDQSQAI